MSETSTACVTLVASGDGRSSSPPVPATRDALPALDTSGKDKKMTINTGVDSLIAVTRSARAERSVARVDDADVAEDDTDGSRDDKRSSASSLEVMVRVDKTDAAKSDPDKASKNALEAISAISPNSIDTLSSAPVAEQQEEQTIIDATGIPIPTEVKLMATDATSTKSGSIKSKVLDAVPVKPHPRVTDQEFHELFPDLPPEDELVEDYNCSLDRDESIDGRLYLSEHCLCFRATLSGWNAQLVIPWSEVTGIEKSTTALLLPNAIRVATSSTHHLFKGLRKRDAAATLMRALWDHAHRHPGTNTGSSEDANDDSSEISYEDDVGERKRFKPARPFISNLLKHARIKKPKGRSSISSDPYSPAEKVKLDAQNASGNKRECSCPAFKDVALEAELPVTPQQAYKLMFHNNTFLRSVWKEELGLHDIEIGDWEGEGEKKRKLEYVKPLNSSVGPKEAKCLLEDAEETVTTDGCICIVTTTRTPDVPSGKNFCTKTRCDFSWSGENKCHLKVTTECEWTKVNRLLKGTIEKSSLEGQADAQSKTVKAACAYIDEHRDEFGLDADAASQCRPVVSAAESTRWSMGRTPTRAAIALLLLSTFAWTLYRYGLLGWPSLSFASRKGTISAAEADSLQQSLERLENTIMNMSKRLDELASEVRACRA